MYNDNQQKLVPITVETVEDRGTHIERRTATHWVTPAQAEQHKQEQAAKAKEPLKGIELKPVLVL